MQWLILAVIAVIAFLCWLGYTDSVMTILGVIIGVYYYTEKSLLKITENITKRYDKQKIKRFILLQKSTIYQTIKK